MRNPQIALSILAALCGVARAQTANQTADQTPLVWNLPPQVLTLFEKLESGQNASLAFVADSLGFHVDSLNWYIRDRFWADYGIGGDGYMAVGRGFSGAPHGPREGLSAKIASPGVVLPPAAGYRSYWGFNTPDGIYATISGTGRFELRLYGPLCRLHYLMQPNGGILRIALNGQVLLDAPTDGPLAHAVFEFSTGQAPDSLCTLALSSADGRLVQPCGIDMRTGLPGYTQHRLARGGSGPFDFIRSNTAPTAGIIADIEPDVVIIMLDWVGENPDKEEAWFIQDTNTLVDFYQQADPNARFILMSHHPFKPSIANEADKLYQIAQDRDLGFINLFDVLPGGFDELSARGFLIDEVHLTPAGGDFFGNYVFDLLKGITIPAAQSALQGVESAKGTVSITWTDNADDETAYQVWREQRVGNRWKLGAVAATLPADASDDSDAPGPGAWRYRVQALKDHVGSRWTDNAEILPAVPAALKAVNADGAASISWTDTSDFETSFTLQRQQYVDGWQKTVTLQKLGADTQQFVDSPGPGKYRYRIKSANLIGASAWTAWSTVTLP